MSAFVCDHEHIAALVGSFITLKDRYTKIPDPVGFARTLYWENMRSVEYRYKDNAQAVAEFGAYWAAHPVTEFQIRRWTTSPLSLGQFFKALDCYEYQACECTDWKQTEAFKLCERMRAQVCARVEGYDTCPWSIERAPPLRLRSA